MDDQKLMPVAWMHIEEGELIAFEDDKNIAEQCEYCVPLYTAQAQREWQGLTDKEYEALAEKHVTNCYFDTLTYARAVEAKLKEKNHG